VRGLRGPEGITGGAPGSTGPTGATGFIDHNVLSGAVSSSTLTISGSESSTQLFSATTPIVTTRPLWITGHLASNSGAGAYMYTQDLFASESGGVWVVNGNFQVYLPCVAAVTFYYSYY
jgi:hypothetical protein